MGKTFRNWNSSESDKRNSRSAKKHAQIKQMENQKQRSKMKRENWGETEG